MEERKKILKSIILGTVFITGACVLVIEIVAARILSPYFGNTIFTYSSVITVILAALSLGYYLGGKLADKKPDFKVFYGIILSSGVTVLFFHLLSSTLLPHLSYNLTFTSGPLISSVILFFLPGFLLGMLSPFAIKLMERSIPDKGVGTISGEVFFWSTAGSIFGSLAAGFFFIPNFSISLTMVGVGCLLVLTGIVGLLRLKIHKKYMLPLVIMVILIIIAIELTELPYAHSSSVFQKDGLYQRINILDHQYKDRPARILLLDRNNSAAMFHDSDELAFDYTKYYSMYRVFNLDMHEALVIGGGGYSIPKALLAELPHIRVDVVEIEPELFELSKKHFELNDDPRLTNYIEDGRRFLRDAEKSYDLIFVDAYSMTVSVPNHLVTQEFFELTRSRLKEDGIVIVNFIGDLHHGPNSFIISQIKTFRSVFDNSYFFTKPKEGIKNFVFVGYNSNRIVADQEFIGDEVINELPYEIFDISSINFTSHPIFTDDYSPVEYFMAQTLKRNKSIWQKK